MPCQGFSLVELLAATLIISVVLAMAGPALGRLALEVRLTADLDALVTAIQLARSESAKRGLPAIVCAMDGPRSCNSSSLDYERGWIVFVNRDDDSPPRIDADDPVLLTHVPETAGSIRSNRSLYIFRPYYRRSTNGTVTFCDRRGRGAARAVIISYTGRPRIAAQGPGGRALDCAS